MSALKSRKEEIIDSLQDIVGKEETKKISVRTAERAASSVVQTAPALKQVEAAVQSVQQAAHQVQSNQQSAQNVDSSSEAGQDYSLWTSKAFTPFVNEECTNQGKKDVTIIAFCCTFRVKISFYIILNNKLLYL